MKSHSIPFILVAAWMFIASPPPAGAQTFDLTGAWKDENGSLYCVRQMGNQLYWHMEARPRVHNVYSGTVAGAYASGEWVDLPGGQMVGNGALSFRVESNSRFVKIGQSGNYGGSVWTRVNNDECGQKRSAGEYWQVTGAGGWTAVWTRRGSSNTFDGVWTSGGNKVTTVVEISVNGRNMTGRRIQSSDNVLCDYRGTLSEDGQSVSGTASCTSGSPWQWSAKIFR